MIPEEYGTFIGYPIYVDDADGNLADLFDVNVTIRPHPDVPDRMVTQVQNLSALIRVQGRKPRVILVDPRGLDRLITEVGEYGEKHQPAEPAKESR